MKKQEKWLKNNRKIKARLNRAILDKGWHLLECFLKYKSNKNAKAFFKIAANQTSLE